MSITLVPATLAHATLLSGMHGICFADAWSVDAMVESLNMPGAKGLLAVDGNSLVPATQPPGPAGMVLWRMAGDEAEILSIAVLPPWRRSGVGRLLLQAVMDEVYDRGAAVMFLEVADDNRPAQALYASLGFNQVGVRKGYYADKDAWVMRKDF